MFTLMESLCLFSFLIALDIKGKAANKLVKWETLQKDNFLSAESKKLRGTDTERLKRLNTK